MPQKKSRVEEKKNEEFRRRWRIAKKLAQDELVWKDKRIQQLEKLVSKLEERVSKESEDVVALCSSDEELFQQEFNEIEKKTFDTGEVKSDFRKLSSSRLHEFVMSLYVDEKNTLHHVLNISREQLDELWISLKPILSGLNMRGSPRQREPAKTCDVPEFDQLVVTLLFLKTFLTWVALSIFCGFKDPRYLAKMVHRVLCAFEILYNTEITMPSDEDIEDMLYNTHSTYFANGHGEWNDIAFFVDGFSIDVPRPSGKDAADEVVAMMKPTHKKRFVANVLLLVLLDGRYVNASQVCPGSHDQRDWLRTGWRSLFVGKRYGIGGDARFTFNHKKEQPQIRAYTPPQKKRGQPTLTDAQLLEHAKFSQLRVIVENAIKRLRSWGCLSQKFRYYSVSRRPVCSLDLCLHACMVIEHRRMKEQPLRPTGWKPKPVQVVHSQSEDGANKHRKLVFGSHPDDVIVKSVDWE